MKAKVKLWTFLLPNTKLPDFGADQTHTLEFDGHKHVLHQIPSRFSATTVPIIGNGQYPVHVFKERVRGLSNYNRLSEESFLYLKEDGGYSITHRLLDAAYEQDKGDQNGSTLKGWTNLFR
jgi:adenylosuccinate synthase